jgi:hypothetical protein
MQLILLSYTLEACHYEWFLNMLQLVKGLGIADLKG